MNCINKFIIFILLPFSLTVSQFKNFHSNIKQNCKYCHIDENGAEKHKYPTWQKLDQLSFYTPYSSPTLDARTSVPMRSSKLCLSCHDGTLSMEHINIPNLSPNQIFGNDISNSHPISFTYDSYLAYRDGELHDPKTTPSGMGGTISSDLLVDGKLECVSCHDIHGFTQQKNLLVMSNYRSKLCLTCHDK